MILTKVPFANAAIGNAPQVLKDIHSPAINIAVYQREIKVLQEVLDQVHAAEIV